MKCKWVSISERLPNDGVDVPIILNGILAVGSHNKNGLALDDDNLFKSCPTWEVGLDREIYAFDAYSSITHWLDSVEMGFE